MAVRWRKAVRRKRQTRCLLAAIRLNLQMFSALPNVGGRCAQSQENLAGSAL